MDTDWAYLDILKNNFEDILENKGAAFKEERFQWFLRNDTPTNAVYDEKTLRWVYRSLAHVNSPGFHITLVVLYKQQSCINGWFEYG